MNNNYNPLCDSTDTSRKRTWQKKIALLLFFVMFSVFGVSAQVTTNGGSGLAGTYGSLSAAITALNGATITSPVVITLSGNETAPAGGYSITKSGTSTNTITIQGSSSTITASSGLTAGSKTDAIFKIIGGDYITIQNFTMVENSANTTAAVATNNMTEFGVALFAASTTDGAQNNTIQNNIITLSSATGYQNAIGVFSTTASSSTNGAQAAASIAGTNSNNKFYGNTISGVAHGFYFISPAQTATVFESGNDIGGTSSATGNTITYGISNTAGDLGFTSYSGSTPAGVYFRNVVGNSVRYNTITSQSGLTLTSGGIFSANGTSPTGVTYTSNFSNNTITITNASTTAVTGIDFGSGLSTGTIIANNNNITLNQNASAANSAAYVGIKASYSSATNTCNSNNITINQTTSGTGVTSSTLTGITQAGAATTINALNNIILFNQTTSSSSAVTSAVNGIVATSASTTVNIGSAGNGNTITVKQDVTGSGSYGSGALSFINVGAGHGTLNVIGNTINNTGSLIRTTSGSTYGINHNGTIVTALAVNNNTINLGFGSTGPSSVYGIYSNSSTVLTGGYSLANNTITLAGTVGSSTAYGIYNADGGSVSNKTVTGNTITISGASTTLKGVYIGYANILTISGNTFDLSSTATAPTAMVGLDVITNATGAHSITNNTITQLTFSGVITSSPTVSGIAIASGNAANVFGSTIKGISVGAATSSGSPIVDGVLVSGGTAINVYQNKIYGITTASTGTSTVVNGIRISGGTANNVYNNLIGGLTASAAASTDALRGISVTSTTTSSTQKIYYNTIYLNGTSSGANFGSSGIYHVYSATATTSALDMRNNIIVNASGANGTGLAVAFRRSSATDLANYATTSNNNLFYGTSGVYNNGTTTYAFGPFQTLVSTRETASKSQNPTFVSTTGSDATFLNFANGAINLAGGNAQVISGYTTDYSGATRDGSAPDMGAYEFNQGSIPAPTIAGFTTAFSPSAPIYLCSAGGSVVTITGTALDTVSSVLFNGGSGVNLAGTITAQSATSLTVTSPAGVVDGIIRVINPGGSADSSTAFTTADPPTVGVSSAATICSGSSTTLTATGANTYVWSPSLGLNGTTGSSVLASPTTSTTYTVTGTSTAGCTATATVAVSVSPVASAISIAKNPGTICIGGTTTLTASGGTVSSSASNYGFAATSGTFTPLSGATAVTSIKADTAISTAVPIGFSFNFGGTNYTNVYADSNGILSFNASATSQTTNTFTSSNNIYPLIAPLWDDNDGSQTVTPGSASYLTTGTAGNRVFTFEWLNWEWNYLANDAVISFQVKLYEADGRIEFIYRSDSAAPVSPSASIGIATANGNYLSLNNSSANPTASSTVNTTTIATKPVTGQVYSFIPPTQPTFAWSPSTGLFTDAAATVPYSGGSQKVVYSKSNSAQTYTATATLGSCPITSSVTVTPNALPTISTNGTSTICAGGAGASLTATGGVSYSWTPTTGLSAANVANPTATPSTTTIYTVTGTDANGCQNTATATVTVNTPVVITTQPANQTAVENGSVSFSVVASGTSPGYQWQYSTNGGSSWSNVEGETSSTYTIASAPASLNNNQYRVIVSGTAPCGSVTSSVVTLLVGSVAIATQPANQTICSNSSATYSIVATGTVTSYQWQYSTNGTTWFDLDGQTNSTLELSGLSSANTGTLFRCSLNAGALNSNSASLTVYDAIVIGTQPASQTVCSNAASVTFTSAATGSGVSYLWQVSTNGGSSWTNISGATAATYTINTPGVGLNNNQYRVVVSGTAPCAAVTSNAATLTVTDVAVAASSTSICIGQSVTLSATYTGVPNTTSSSWVCATTGSGATTAVSGDSAVVTPTAAGTYVYTFTTNGSCSFTRTVSVTVNALPIISAVTATPATVCSGGTINLAATSTAIAAGSVTLGTGTATTSTAGISPYSASWEGSRIQYLVKASELTALGLVAGNITSLAFNVTTAGSYTQQGYTVKIGHTNDAAFSGAYATINGSFTTVYGPVAKTTPAVGNDVLTFTTPFSWNGTSNIVVEICHDNDPTATCSSCYGSTSTVSYSTTTYNSVYGKYADNTAMCGTTNGSTISTFTNRPNMIFAGQASTNLASTYTWSWNTSPAVTTATGTTSVANTSGSAVSQTFTATATNTAGCISSLTSSAVTVNSTIPTPTATNGTQCGTGTPTCSVTGSGRPGNTFRWYTVSTNGTAISGQTGSTLVAPYTIAATTTFYVAEFDGLCEGPRVAVTQTVTTPFAFALSASTATNCSGSNSLTPVTITTNGGYDTFTWSNSATVSGDSSIGWTFRPTTTTTYTLTATGGGCSTTANVVVTPTALPVVTVTANPAAICVGASSTLTALTKTVTAGTAKIGSGTTAEFSYSIFRHGYGNGDFRHQLLYTASELSAAGLSAGPLTSVSFNVTTLGSTGYTNYKISLANVSATALTTTFDTSALTQVYLAPSFTLAAGLNTFTFGTGAGSSGFVWDGTSSILVNICYTVSGSNSTSYVEASTTSSNTNSQLLGTTGACTATTATTAVTSRPNATFAGQVASQGVGTLAYTWNGSSTTGNVLTASPTTTTTYTVYGLNGTTGCTGTATATVTVYAPPTAPSVTNAVQCGARVPLVSVADTNGYTTPTFKWYADNTTNTALQTSTSTTFTGSISTTTTFYVSVVSPGGCESPRAAVTTTVVAPATLTVTPDTTVCTAGSTTLTASGAVSYTWSPALGLNGTTGASVVATPSATTTYSVTGVDSNGCTTAAATVKVTVAPYPTAVTITPGAASVCTNGVMSLTASGGTFIGSGNATSGTGTTLTSSTSYPTAFANYWYKNWQQYLFTKAELNAIGITGASNITSLKFNIAALPDAATSITDYSVKIASTANTALSTFTTTGLTNVFGPAAVSPVVGVNTITFSTPYAWDGNSNIIIDIRQSEGYGSANATTYYTATTNNSVIYAYDSGPSSTFYTSSPTATTSTSRPNLVFGYTATVSSPITWSPTTDLYTDAAGTTAYTGGAASIVYTKPSMERTYTATASNGACTTPATITVTPVALPTFAINGTTTICKGQSTVLTATGAGLTYTWSPALGLNGTTGATVTANPTVTTTYTVEATNASGCKSIQTVTVTVSEPGAILSGTTSQLGIPGGNTTFSVVTASGATYTYQWQLNDGSGWVNLDNDSHYSGVNTATLTVTNIQEAWSGYQYQCLVTGASPCATLTPIVATLTISSTGIETQPQNVTVCDPGTTSFSIVTNGDEPYGILWQMSTDNGVTFTDVSEGTDSVTGLTFTGVDTTTLAVSGVTFANNGIKFLCVLNYYLLSDSATLTVKQPVAASNPANQTVCASGGTATFSTTATGSDLAYQWQFSTNGGTTWASYTGTGATTASISIVNPALGLNGTQYRVVVSGNAACSSVTTAAATLFINNPTITAAPVAATVLRGNAATFTVAASAATSYQWQRSATLNGTYVDVVDATPTGVSYTGATTANLTVLTSATTATGTNDFYRCVVTNNGCTVTSTGASLTVNWYCTPAPTSVDGTGITNVTMGDINNTTAAETGNYGDYTTYNTSAAQLSTVNFAITYATGYTYGTKIWIDFNDNGSFADSGEQVYFGLSTNTNPTTLSGSFLVPLTAPLGSHRMRIGGSDNDAGVDPCYSSTFAAFEDYTFTVTAAPTCSGTPVAGTASTPNVSLCSGGLGTTLTLTGYTTGVTNVTLQWYMSTNGTTFTPIAGATRDMLFTDSLTTNTSYYCAVTCTNSNQTVNSNIVDITVYDPQVASSTPAGRCGTGTVTLGATANAGSVINWFAAATGGTSLGTGTSFTTPSIATTTTYYAEASTSAGLRSQGGLGNTSIPTSTGASAERGIVFTANSNGTIVSAQYYSPTLNVTNAVTARLVDNTTGTQVGSSVSLSIPQGATAGFYTMNLNFPVTAGTTYRLLASFSQSVNRISTGANYATAAFNNLGTLGTITSGYDSGVSTTSYNYFHNIVAQVPGCTSARTAVVATVTPAPTATISYATPICSTAGVAAVTLNGTNAYTGGTFSSTAGLVIDPATGAINVASSTPGTYTVTYAIPDTGYCTGLSTTTTVTINQALTSGFAYDFANYCTNQGVITPTVSGTAGVFTASPAGLSINATTGAITLATSAAGTYTVTNTVSVAGCANSVSTFDVTVNTAVAITSQPVSVSKLPGDNASFSVAATGTGLTYQWEVNNGSGWTALSGETASTLSLTAVTSEMNGYQYRVVVSGAAACASVTSSVVTLTVSTAAIATQPVNFTACSEGANTASFSVTTTGTVDTYQWQVSTNGTTWTDITNGGIYADATTATLSLSGLSLTNDQWQFRVVLNSAVYSNPATLTIKTAVAIATQPSSTTGCTGGSASFTVAATGSGLGYQWQVSTNGTTWNNVSGATSATLTLNSLTASMNGYQYKAIVSGASPCSALTSSIVTLTVNTAVAITTQPANTTVCNAANATFSVVATGSAPTYQWQMSTNGTTYTDMSGETASSLTVSAVTLGMNGYKYRVVIAGAAPCASVTSNAATLTVSQPVAPTVTASSTDFCTGSVVTLTAGNIATDAYANSFDALPANFATSVVGSGTPSVTLNTTYKTEGTGSVLFNTASTSANVAYAMNANLNLSTASSATVTFSHIAAMEGPTTSYDYGYVEYSSNGGTTWTTFPATNYVGSAATSVFTSGNVRFTTKSYADWTAAFTGTTSVPTNALWKNETFTIPAAALTSQFRIRFRYTTDSSTNYYGWLIDNVKVSVPNGTVTWSPTTGLFTNAAATTAYTGGNAAVVYAKPTVSSSYTVTTTSSLGCTNTGSVSLNLLTPSTLSSITQPSITCSGAQTTFNLTGLLPNSTSTINYTINGAAQTAITGVVANASGNASFTVALPAVNNGRTLAITSLTRTDLTPSCTTAITANNTVVIAVQPLVTYYADADGDGFGNNAVTQITCQGQPAGYVTNNTDCDDTDNTKHATFNFYVDADGDGFGAGAPVALCAVNGTTPPTAGYVTNNTDCNDADATKNASYSFYVDADGDGYGAGSLVSVCAVNATTPPSGYSLNGTDCDDADATKWRSTTLYVDADADGYDNGTATVCWGATVPTGYSQTTLGTDCNDANASATVPVTNTSTVTACGSYVWSVNGNTYTSSGTYTSVVNSCLTEVLHLTISCSSVVTITANIEGYYDAGTHAMRPVLMNQGVGSSSTDVDHITVELHDASTYALVATTTAMLQTNGTAVATYSTAPSGSFYVVVKHRNSLETWSATPVAVGPTPASYNFTDAASKAYGNNMKMLETGVYGFYSGDINQDGFIEAQDFPPLTNDSDNFAEGNYNTDLNGDGFVEAQDFPILVNNSDNFIESIHP
ncbi:hypothetical protein EZL74_11475 [Flavobacterium silvisoli]|uniref:Ig-like domain-containing protein n=1 Tax=Flavobacterium silvisoli TaxID=2529433 RepID=A0A4Q9YR67_9FLAO|nr:GEVED domain-containing protein [Flavobacterium silvisoli]TBX65986.1 hypothetical protein EZL74_11475 [Flavobacterium silvisoli]